MNAQRCNQSARPSLSTRNAADLFGPGRRTGDRVRTHDVVSPLSFCSCCPSCCLTAMRNWYMLTADQQISRSDVLSREARAGRRVWDEAGLTACVDGDLAPEERLRASRERIASGLPVHSHNSSLRALAHLHLCLLDALWRLVREDRREALDACARTSRWTHHRIASHRVIA